jgi:hypothetical protein
VLEVEGNHVYLESTLYSLDYLLPSPWTLKPPSDGEEDVMAQFNRRQRQLTVTLHVHKM